jgi:hypothetical protein
MLTFLYIFKKRGDRDGIHHPFLTTRKKRQRWYSSSLPNNQEEETEMVFIIPS